MKTDDAIKGAVFIIFGAAGDLTWRKVIPALYNLYLDQFLPEAFSVFGLDLKSMTQDEYRKHLHQGVNRFSRRGRVDEKTWNAFAGQITYVSGDFTGADIYDHLGKKLASLEKDQEHKADRIFYLAVPPAMIETVAKHLAKAKLAQHRKHARLVVEKPIGYDLESAMRLNRILVENFDESQIFRIDHYLGKETVQNILAFRFANPLFEPIWDRRYVDHVTISVAEEVGVEHRGGYYDKAGALRDMVQNHLMQLLCLVAMEPPVSFDADEVRNKKADVLHAIRPITPDSVHSVAARGQYNHGWVMGKHVPAYREEPGVAADSNIETFVALKLFVDNWRWQDVPFYLRTGKRMPRQVSEISIRFRAVPHQSFPPEAALDWQPARLIMCIQPDEGIVLRFQAKQPGLKVRLNPVDMNFSYQEAFQAPSPDAYETLIWDVMINDATLFMREDQVEAAWSLLMPVLDVWASRPPNDFPNYPAGTWGPESAEILIAQDGRSWTLPAKLRNQEDESA